MNIGGHDIGVCSWSLQPRDTAHLVDLIKQLGLGHVQLALGPLLMLDDKRKHSELGHLRGAGLKLTAGMIAFPGEVDTPELQQIKALIRRTEARAGAKFSGVREENIHFLDLPFYETGRVRKKPLGEEDYRITVELLEQVKPHQIYAAGDLSDPHGTHRVCLAAIFESLRRIRAKGSDWVKHCEVWLYRGAWQEWGVHEIEMAVPLSPDELLRKRMAIFKHESQKDKALFPGPSDPREFWQRAEDRNKGTADRYNRAGLPEFYAMEAFVRWNGVMV
jgi:glucosamine-6-phosphate deaminase